MSSNSSATCSWISISWSGKTKRIEPWTEPRFACLPPAGKRFLPVLSRKSFDSGQKPQRSEMLSLALTAEDRTYNQVIMRGWRSPARRYPLNGQRNLTPETNMIEKLYYTVNEAAAAAGISRTKLYEDRMSTSLNSSPKCAHRKT